MNIADQFVPTLYNWAKKHKVTFSEKDKDIAEQVTKALGCLYVSLLLHEKAQLSWVSVIEENADGVLIDFLVETIQSTPLESLVDDEVTHRRQSILDNLLKSLNMKKLQLI